MYLLLLLIGLVGLVAMTLLGFSHAGAGHSPHAIGGHGSVGGQAHALAGHHGAGAVTHQAMASRASVQPAKSGSETLRSMASYLPISPLDLFSLCFGAGFVGLALQSLVKGVWLPWIAAAGAMAFWLGIERTAMSLAMRFVSKPAEGLEGVIAQTAIAVTGFDQDGRGLVKLCIDDQDVQVLAILDPAEVHRGVHVNKGDEVVVTVVDTAKNSCQVTKELSI